MPEPAPSIQERTQEFARGSDLIGRAFAFASVVHADQRRKDGNPFIAHPIAVASLVSEAGLDEPLVAAAVLHDVLEKSPVDEGEIGSRFSEHVRKLVEAMTEDEAIVDYQARKVAHREQVELAGAEAAAIYAADKLANLREMQKLYEQDGERIASLFKAPIDVRVGLWLEDAEMVGRVAPKLPYLRDLRAELESFQALRQRGGVRAAASS